MPTLCALSAQVPDRRRKEEHHEAKAEPLEPRKAWGEVATGRAADAFVSATVRDPCAPQGVARERGRDDRNQETDKRKASE